MLARRAAASVRLNFPCSATSATRTIHSRPVVRNAETSSSPSSTRESGENAGKSGGSRSKEDPLAPARLQKLYPDSQTHSYYTEMVRYRKALVCMYEDKIREEFPHLRDYAVEYEPRDRTRDILQFEQAGLVYPGADDKPDPSLVRKCVLRVKVPDLLAHLAASTAKQSKEDSSSTDPSILRRNISLLMGDAYDPQLDLLTIVGNQFPEYGMNKKYTVDCLLRLVQVIQNTANASLLDRAYEEAEQAKKQQERVERQVSKKAALKRVASAFPEEWKRQDMAHLSFQMPRGEQEQKEELVGSSSEESATREKMDNVGA